MNDNTLQTHLREVTRLTMAGQLQQATALIQHALGGASMAGSTEFAQHEAARSAESILDGFVFEVPSGPSLHDKPPMRTRPAPDEARPGEFEAFIAAMHTHAGLTRRYKLYVPPGHAGKPLPLVVMLHGCTQDPDDFAAGTAMNERAREQGFFVLYPAQAQDANPSRCWNWFKHNHQQRGRGEPALIADLTQSVIKQYGMDSSRVYIAGLSAGGAMAAVVAEAYPDIFAAVGIHSGLPLGAATNVAEALAVMKSGAPVKRASSRSTHAHAHSPVPAIVFHGDKDQTVHPRNGEQIIAGLMGQLAHDPHGQSAEGPQVEQGTSTHGRGYTRSVHHGNDGHALAEHWVLHGVGHAWSGGQSIGSYTDANGPDATREMLRFFFEHLRESGTPQL